MKESGRIAFKKISDKKYLYKLPESFIKDEIKNIAIYARVSTPKQKKDLENQINCLKQYVVSNGSTINEEFVFSDIASGMNENRNGLNKLLNEILNNSVSKVIISNRDRLTRFGFGYFKNLFEKFDVEIVEVNMTDEKTFEEELTSDLIAIIHHFSMKFYGKRKNILNQCKKEIEFFDKND
jgi:predicted site-specific integrase-resolvase